MREVREKRNALHSPAAVIEGISQLITPLMYARSASYSGSGDGEGSEKGGVCGMHSVH